VRLGFGKGKWGWGRDLALSQFSENRGGVLQNCQAGACSRAEEAEHALRDACPVKHGEEGKQGHLLRTLIECFKQVIMHGV
jgi:hypothetical protein